MRCTDGRSMRHCGGAQGGGSGFCRAVQCGWCGVAGGCGPLRVAGVSLSDGDALTPANGGGAAESGGRETRYRPRGVEDGSGER